MLLKQGSDIMRIRLLKRTSGSFAECILERGTAGQWEVSLENFTTGKRG